MIEIRRGRPRGEQDEPQPPAAPPGFERRPGGVPGEVDLIEIVHAGAAEGAVAHRETGRLDQMRLQPQAGGQAENRAGVLRDVGLVEGDAHWWRGGTLAHVPAKWPPV